MPSSPTHFRRAALFAKRLGVAGLNAVPTPFELLAARMNQGDIPPLSVGVVHVGFAQDRSLSSLAALQRALSAWRRDHTLLWCHVRNGGTGTDEATAGMLSVEGANEEREFSGFRAGIVALRAAGAHPDVWVMANDRWDVDCHSAFRRPRAGLANVAEATGGMVGRVDRFPHTVSFQGAAFRWWVRSNLIVISDAALADVAVVGYSRRVFDACFPAQWPGTDWLPPGLDPAYWALVLEWLTGGPGPLAEGWYQQQPVTAATWPDLRLKVLSVLNEHLLSAACLDANHPIIDFATADRFARLGMEKPAVASCLRDRRSSSQSRRPIMLTAPPADAAGRAHHRDSTANSRYAARYVRAGPGDGGGGRSPAKPADRQPVRTRPHGNACRWPVPRQLLRTGIPIRRNHSGYADPVAAPGHLVGVEGLHRRVGGRPLSAMVRCRARGESANALAGLTPGPGVVRSFSSNPTVRRLARQADIVEVHFTQFLPVAAALLPRLTATVVSAFAYDVFTQSVSRQTSAVESTFWRIGARIATAVAARKEPRLLNRCSVVCVFSAKDVSLLRSLNVSVPVHIMSPNIDVPAATAKHDGPPVVLFSGAMFRRVNYRAIDGFLQTGWPRVRAAVPDARFVIAGAEPPPHLVSDTEAGVEVTGFVEDLDAVYRDASCFVAPLTSGAGVKFKVVQAMAWGLPVVGTPVAFEGLPDAPGVIVDSNIQAADEVIRLLRDRDRRVELGISGRAYVKLRFDFARSVEDLHAHYGRLLHRNARFTADPSK